MVAGDPIRSRHVPFGGARGGGAAGEAGAVRPEPFRGSLAVAAGEVTRGVHPQVLTDRGLPAAVDDLAGRAPVPVHTDFDLPGRLPGAVELAAYFVVAEALTNVARHSGATRAAVRARVWEERLVLEVSDDGRGGADPAAGSGLRGLADGVVALGGRFGVADAPAGGTVVTAELPLQRHDR